MKNALTTLLQIDTPIIQAPMAGGPTTPELVASVSNCGGLGSLGAGYLQPEALRVAIQEIRALTTKNFNVNLFVPGDYSVSDAGMQQSCDAINTCSQELNACVQPVDGPYSVNFDEQVSVLLELACPVVSFIFGVPPQEVISVLKKNGSVIMATATTREEALFLQKRGVDVIVAQGSEAGGHRGSFLKKEEECLVALDDLMQQCAAVVRLPIVAAGGIMNGTDIARVLALGASAAQMGSLFLCTPESGVTDAYRDILLQQQADNTVLTRAFSGRLARGIDNHFTRCMRGKTDSIADYPVQNKLTSSLRKKAKELGNTDYMSLWAGQKAYAARALPVCKLMQVLATELDEVIKASTLESLEKQQDVTLHTYDPQWPEGFEKEARQIRACLGENCLQIHHVGSTAVPGLAAKPIIDILVVVDDLGAVDATPNCFAELAYVARGEYGLPGRRFFWKTPELRSYNIHLFEKRNVEVNRLLCFRDYLREKAAVTACYEAIKLALAQQFPADIVGYVTGKASFVQAIDYRTENAGQDQLKAQDGVVLETYNPRWEKWAAAEIEAIKNTVNLPYESIDHLGSTSIPGMLAKPVLDIFIGLKDMEHADDWIVPLQNLGYIDWPENPDKSHARYFKGMPPFGTARTHHVHIMKVGDDLDRRLLFRDRLLGSEELRGEYATLKEALVNDCPDDRERYTDEKGSFVRRVLRQ